MVKQKFNLNRRDFRKKGKRKIKVKERELYLGISKT